MNEHLPTLFQSYIHLSKYSRWLHDEGRRETWNETVGRYFDFFEEHLEENVNFNLSKELRNKLETAVLNLKVMPSMRCMMTAGEALKRENIAGYNCCYIAIDNQKSFDEILYILMNGTGVGFSVEQKFTGMLPIVSEDFHPTDTTIVVADSKLGWAKALRELISLLYAGYIPKYDLSKLRPAGAVLKTFGGRSAGPGPLEDLFKFAINLFKKAAGRRLTSLECHDLVCKIGDIVVSGGVRRSALISLSDLFDDRMRLAKSGEWWTDTPQRALANNSYVITDDIDVGMFMKEWLALYESKSGERGIFSRAAAKKQVKKYGRRKDDYEFGCNPCCLPANTVILTSKGAKTIKEIVADYDNNEYDYKIWAQDIEKNETLYAELESASLTRKNAELIELCIVDECDETIMLRLTPDHKVYTSNRGYIEAKDLVEEDDLVITLIKNKTIKGKVKRILPVSNEDTYDIQTSTGNFFANDVLVHNSEILLRSREFCNLSEVVIRAEDTINSIKQKLELAVIIGCFQCTLTNFRYVSKKFRENCEEERLLGVSLTGIMDNNITNGKEGNLQKTLDELREHVVKIAKEWSTKLNINMPVAITCVKPSGTVSSLVNSASGIHERYSPFYIRTVRQDKKDPLTQMMIDIGIPYEDDVMKPNYTTVFSFPISSPKESIFRGSRTAIEQLEFWLTYQRHWCEHKPSITVSVKEDEWFEVGAWIWEHLGEMSGVSFLPYSDTIYRQAPFQEIKEEQYIDMMNEMPKNVNWDNLSDYEKKDNTTSSQELACSSVEGCNI